MRLEDELDLAPGDDERDGAAAVSSDSCATRTEYGFGFPTVTLTSPVGAPVGRRDCVGAPAVTVSAEGPELPAPVALPAPALLQYATALPASGMVAQSITTTVEIRRRRITARRSR